MKNLVEGFSTQLKDAIKIGQEAQLHSTSNEIRNVLISGLGGSGIGGSIVSQLVAGEANVPIAVNKDYFLPEYVNSNTLVVISSYSGNTEETTAAMEIAMKKGAEVCCVTSGGKVLEVAKEKGLNCIQIPSGFPPRAAFAYSSTQLFYVLKHYGIIGNSFEQDLAKVPDNLDQQAESIQTEAAKVTDSLYATIPIIYSEASFEGVAIRFRQQLNENSKMLCWHHAVPEMNHNELVGWAGGNADLSVLIFRNETDYSRSQKRIEINKEVFVKYTQNITEVWSKGSSNIERSYYLIHLGDWVSVLLAEKKAIDPVEVNVIDFLKGSLANV